MGYESPTVACIHRPRAGPEIISCFRLRHPAGPPLISFYRMPFQNRQSRHQIFVFFPESVLDLLCALNRK